MNENYEDWSLQQWLLCLRKREHVFADYMRALEDYSGLPACDALVDRKMLKKYRREEIDNTLYSVFYPANHIQHEWDKNSEMPEDEDDCQDDAEPEDAMPGQENWSMLSQACYTDIVKMTNRWIGCMTCSGITGDAKKLFIPLLTVLSQVSSSLYACSISRNTDNCALVGALVKHSIDKCMLIQQCLLTMKRGQGAAGQFAKELEDMTVGMDVLDKHMKDYLELILSPGGHV